ncbi:MAG: hypothetical protein JXB49_08715 [Bacteroidales bacterium]|nr:hypothetical protein [Bacteroidales bacterium]
MKKVLTVILLSMFALSFMNCAGGIAVQSDPFEMLQQKANKIIESGGVAAVGEREGARADIAKEKATTAARALIAQSFETKVEDLRKMFLEEIGSTDAEINEAFTAVTKTVTNQTLVGSVVIDSKYYNNKKTNRVHYAVLVGINPKTLDQSILDEMQKKPKLYERFRASKAYEELDREMQDYEKEKAAGKIDY